MISKTMEKALNGQLNAETYSAYLYWAMSAALERMDLPGFANWMRVQAQEEMTHAIKFYNHIIGRGGTVRMGRIDAPQGQFKDVDAIFKAALEHEQLVTSLIHKLVDLAAKEKDHAVNMFLQWFVNEQVEEEANAEKVIARLKMCKGSTGALYMLDKEMGARVFTPPAAPAE